jgi:hypothetical protein
MFAWSNAWVCGHSLAGFAGSNPNGWHGYLSVVSVVFCQVEVSVRADHSSRGVLPTVVCLSVIMSPDNEEAMAHWRGRLLGQRTGGGEK